MRSAARRRESPPPSQVNGRSPLGEPDGKLFSVSENFGLPEILIPYKEFGVAAVVMHVNLIFKSVARRLRLFVGNRWEMKSQLFFEQSGAGD
jgi:hypothetical protein